MKKLILLICAILMIVIITNKYKEDYYTIPNQSIRVRIVPNSNSIEDQITKKIVKNNLELELENDLKNVKTLPEARKVLKNSIKNYKKVIEKSLENSNKKIKYKINYGKNFFPEKEYKGVKYKQGVYESLVVTLGKGEGNNWWCVLFPPICSIETEEKMNKVEYTTYIKEIFSKYF